MVARIVRSGLIRGEPVCCRAPYPAYVSHVFLGKDGSDVIPGRNVVRRGMDLRLQTGAVHFPAPFEEDLLAEVFDSARPLPDHAVVAACGYRPGVGPGPGQQQRASLAQEGQVAGARERVLPQVIDVHDGEPSSYVLLQAVNGGDVGAVGIGGAPYPGAEVGTMYGRPWPLGGIIDAGR